MFKDNKNENVNLNKVLNIGIDAMGGDNAPIEIINGVVDYINQTPDEKTIVTLIGNENIIQAKLMNYDVDLKRIEIKNATEIITGEDHPTEAIRHKKDSSKVFSMPKSAFCFCLLFTAALLAFHSSCSLSADAAAAKPIA